MGPVPDLFWRSTPRELSAYMAGARKRYIRDHNMAVTAAYYGGIVAKAAKNPSLKDLMIDERPAVAAPSWQRLWQAAKAWDAAINARRRG